MYTCNICGKNFVTNYVLKRHTLQVHEKNAVFQCADCSKKFVRERDLKRHRDSVHSTEKITCKFCYTSFTRKYNLLKHLNNKRCERKLEKEAGKRKRLDLSVSSRKKKTHLFTSAENSTADPENIFLPPKENERAFQKAYKTFNLPNNDSSLGIKEFLLLRKEETIFIFRNELETYKALKVSKWVHCIYSKATDAGKMIKNVEFKTPNNEVLQETNLARLYDDMSEKIVKESGDFEGRDSGWTLDEILRLEVRTNRYSPFRGSSSFIEVPKQIAETKAIINVINKKDSQCFMWSILAALYPNTSNPNKTSSYVPHLNKLNFDGISFPTPLNELSRGHYKDPVVYRGIDAPKIFIEKLEKDAIEIDNIYKKSKPLLPLTESEKQLYDNANNCYVCGQTFHENNIKITTCFFFIEKGVRGGISQCCNRYAIANNRYMSNFNPDDEIKYLMYLDANNLYGYAMSKYLPLKDFVWSDNDLTEQDILNLSDESDVGYILEVDLEYPSDLHDKHSDFPLAPENKPPPNSVEKNNSTRPLGSKIKANAGEKQLNSSVGTKQLNSTGENNSTRQHERNNSTGENNSTQQQERTTQLGSRNETTQLASRNETTQLVSRNETTQLCTAVDRLQPPTTPTTAYTAYNRLQPPATACNRLQPPTTAYNAYNRLQPPTTPTTACNRLQPPTTACTAFTAESAFST
ncbi:c2H2-type domain-containing protein [Trichonephila clavipes]|uniref:C2H2-type domain-containing protein n=1 Tax=Trichonephila clavipes TaxID=2585209 RepID=A0A8X6V5A5_TRICX|nr:c2H2-type domain-containing protein [Trichonephila clavipes]